MVTPWGVQIGGAATQPPQSVNLPADSIFADVRLFHAPDVRLAQFEDDVWDLQPMTPRGGNNAWITLRFEAFPQRYVQTVKRVAWCWINLRTPTEKITRRNAARERLAPKSIAFLVNVDLRYFFTWMETAQVTGLSELRKDNLEAYAEHLRTTYKSPDRIRRMLFSVTRIWLMAPFLPDGDRLRMPPWEIGGFDEIVGKSNWSPENKTPPIHPQTMSMLYVWAERFVNEFAPDILNAIALNEKIDSAKRIKTRPGDQERFEAYLSDLKAKGQPLPGFLYHGRTTPSLARRLISGLNDIGRNAMHARYVPDYPIATTAPLPLEIHGRIEPDGGPWLPFIDHYEVTTFRRHLAIACLIITAYLSGMRSDEVLALRRGCLTIDGQGAGQPDRYFITGLHFKSATDQRGNSIPEGSIRNRPWHVIEPVAHAIQVVSQLSDSNYIFDWTLFVSSGGQRNTIPPSVVANRAIIEFINWVKEYCAANGLPHESIPSDPDGTVNLSRFRRTLAWFIFRQPGGRIALGVQYGHLRSYTSEGYGSRASSGMRGVYPVEEALAIADTLGDAADRLAAGEAVSGPATDRYIDGVSEYANNFAGKRLTTKQLNALHKNPRLRIFDNGLQPVACCYDATKSLCHPDNARTTNVAQTPDLTRCQPRCANVARTDRHIDTIRAEIKELRNIVGLSATPEPIVKRYQQRIEALETLIHEHERGKVTVPL